MKVFGRNKKFKSVIKKSNLKVNKKTAEVKIMKISPLAKLKSKNNMSTLTTSPQNFFTSSISTTISPPLTISCESTKHHNDTKVEQFPDVQLVIKETINDFEQPKKHVKTLNKYGKCFASSTKSNISNDNPLRQIYNNCNKTNYEATFKEGTKRVVNTLNNSMEENASNF